MLCFIVLHLYTFLYVIVINTNLCLAGVRFPFGQELNTVSLSMVYIRNCKCIHPALDFVLFFRKRSHAFCCLCVCTYCFSFYVYYYLLHFLIFGLDFFLLHDPVWTKWTIKLLTIIFIYIWRKPFRLFNNLLKLSTLNLKKVLNAILQK